MVTNTNFPAPLQVLALLGTVFTIVVLGALAMYGGILKRRWTKWALGGIAAVVGCYIVLLVAFSAFSKEQVLKIGEEKYFCEIDCHIAYSLAEVRNVPIAGTAEEIVILGIKTRFDEKTISPQRPKDAPLEPNPRELTFSDERGRVFPAIERSQVQFPAGTQLGERLIPGQSYVSYVAFRVPVDARGLKLLISTVGGPEKILIGSELSYLHKKTYLKVGAAPDASPVHAAR